MNSFHRHVDESFQEPTLKSASVNLKFLNCPSSGLHFFARGANLDFLPKNVHRSDTSLIYVCQSVVVPLTQDLLCKTRHTDFLKVVPAPRKPFDINGPSGKYSRADDVLSACLVSAAA